MRRVTRRRVLGTVAVAGSSSAAGASASGRAVPELGVAWERRYGDGGYDRLEAAATADDGAVLAGRSDDPPGGRWRAWLHRTGSDGETRWHRTFEDDWLEAALAVASVEDGFVVAGRRRTGSSSPFDAWVRRTDAEGRVLWHWTSDADGRDEATAVVGGDPVRVAGTTGGGDADPWIRTFDTEGSVERYRTYSDERAQRVHDVAAAGDGAVLLAGTQQAADQQYADAWLARVDSRGEMAWSRSYGGDRAERASAVSPTDDGAVFAGLTGSEGDGLWDLWLARVDADGERRWTRTHGGGGADYATDLLAVPGGYVVVGASSSGDRYRFDALTLGVTREGGYRWHRFDGGPGRDVARAVLPWTGRDGGDDVPGALVAGQYSSAPDRIDAWLLGLSPDTGTLTPQSTTAPTETPPATPVPTPTDSPTPTYEGVDMADVRDDETTTTDGPGFGLVGALAALGLGGWLSRRTDDR